MPARGFDNFHKSKQLLLFTMKSKFNISYKFFSLSFLLKIAFLSYTLCLWLLEIIFRFSRVTSKNIENIQINLYIHPTQSGFIRLSPVYIGQITYRQEYRQEFKQVNFNN